METVKMSPDELCDRFYSTPEELDAALKATSDILKRWHLDENADSVQLAFMVNDTPFQPLVKLWMMHKATQALERSIDPLTRIFQALKR